MEVKCWPPYWGRENCLAGQVHHCFVLSKTRCKKVWAATDTQLLAVVQNRWTTLSFSWKRGCCILFGTTPQKVWDYQEKIQTQVENQIRSELERKRWKSHHLYKSNTKLKLEAMCRDLRIPVTPALQKHRLVNLICDHPCQIPYFLYTLENCTKYHQHLVQNSWPSQNWDYIIIYHLMVQKINCSSS